MSNNDRKYRKYNYCPICYSIRRQIEYVFGGKRGLAKYCSRGHKITGLNNDLHLIRGATT